MHNIVILTSAAELNAHGSGREASSGGMGHVGRSKRKEDEFD